MSLPGADKAFEALYKEYIFHPLDKELFFECLTLAFLEDLDPREIVMCAIEQEETHG